MPENFIKNASCSESIIPVLINETDRVAALYSYHILDTAEEKDFDDLTTLASAICQIPVALVSLVDKDRQWFKSHKGTTETQTPKEWSFCAHAIVSPDPIMIVQNTAADTRFSANPLVTGDPKIVFYAGVPLINPEGFALGTLCVIDTKVRDLSEEQIAALMIVANQVMDKLELRRKLIELKLTNQKLLESRERELEMTEELIAINEELIASNEELNASKDYLMEVNHSLNESEQRLKIALDAGALGSTEVELSTGVMTCNEQFKRCYGRTKDEVFNYPDLFEAMLPEYREEIRRLVAIAIKEHAIYKAEYEVKWPDGSVHWISAHGKARYDNYGKAYRMVGVVSDVTESKLFQQRKDDFLSIASHELKTPVTTLKASLQLLNLIKDKPFSERHVKLIEQANRSMEKMSKLMDDLLNINRMSEGQLRLEKSTFNIAQMLSCSCNHVRLEGKHELILQGDEDLQINADEHRVEQVVINFVNNAVKYAPDSKKIYLQVEKLDNYARISVKDNGPGITAEIMPYLFDRYYRADYSGAAYTGLGLGLYICAEIVKRHGGQIGVDSEIQGGSTFWFTLPI